MDHALAIHGLTEQGAAPAALDAEHAAIESHLRALQAAVMSDASTETVAGILDVCIEFCKAHFIHEEGYMDQYRYTELDAHRAAHGSLLEKFQRARAVAANRDLITGVLDGFDLLHEFERHVNTCDQPMHEEIQIRLQQQLLVR
jgi:hemerythrin-like metal-binding protein